MALYRYVDGRDDLLDAVVSTLLDGLDTDLDANLIKIWQGHLQAFAQAVRRIAVDHPAAFSLVAARHPTTAWLRPPLRSLELVEDFLTTLSGYGFTDRQVVGVYRAFSSFLLGSLLLESAVRGADADTSPVDRPVDGRHAAITNSDARSTSAPASPSPAYGHSSAKTAAKKNSTSPCTPCWTGSKRPSPTDLRPHPQ